MTFSVKVHMYWFGTAGDDSPYLIVFRIIHHHKKNSNLYCIVLVNEFGNSLRIHSWLIANTSPSVSAPLNATVATVCTYLFVASASVFVSVRWIQVCIREPYIFSYYIISLLLYLFKYSSNALSSGDWLIGYEHWFIERMTVEIVTHSTNAVIWRINGHASANIAPLGCPKIFIEVICIALHLQELK